MSATSTDTDEEKQVPSLAQWLAERNRAFETMDMEYARRTMPNATDDVVRIVAMHKARYECTAISDSLRRDSEAFLKSGGYGRCLGLPWPKRGLPK